MSQLTLPPSSRLLVVEDMEPLRRYLCETLSELEGVSAVVGVSDGLEALERIDEEEPFNLIVTDITMPRMDGETLIRELQQRRYPGAVVVLSAHGQDDLIIRCMRGGAVDYLIKPVSINDLYTAVTAAVQHSPRLAEDELEVDYDPYGWFEVTGSSSYSVLYRYRRFLGLLSKLHIPEDVANEVRLALEELGRNAIEWGNAGDSSKKVSLSCRILPTKVILVISDEGQGFNPQAIPDPSQDPLGHIEQRQKDGKRLGGYGIHLVRNIMDKITWNEQGNKVIAVKYLRTRSD